jgi:hypothetical protein
MTRKESNIRWAKLLRVRRALKGKRGKHVNFKWVGFVRHGRRVKELRNG